MAMLSENQLRWIAALDEMVRDVYPIGSRNVGKLPSTGEIAEIWDRDTFLETMKMWNDRGRIDKPVSAANRALVEKNAAVLNIDHPDPLSPAEAERLVEKVLKRLPFLKFPDRNGFFMRLKKDGARWGGDNAAGRYETTIVLPFSFVIPPGWTKVRTVK